ncbi:MAG TPA: hypothetical protein VJN70_17805 [Gemmatimonadaceae bacterium]|nr:hypothetical protein [Gemmatimonadaceae bacterium]
MSTTAEGMGGAGGASRRRGVLLLLAMFVAGGLAGAAIDRAYSVRHRSTQANNEAAQLAARRETERRTLSGRQVEIPFALARLDLTPQQEEQIRRIVLRIRPRTDSLWNAVRPRAQALESQVFQESLCVLTPQQIDHYKDYQRAADFPPAITTERLRLVTTGTCPSVSP